MIVRHKKIWLIDFEFYSSDGDLPTVLCLAAHEINSGKSLLFWKDELENLSSEPFSTGEDSLFIAYYSSAEWGCFIRLGWAIPIEIIDLYVEYKCSLNGRNISSYGLLDALRFYGIEEYESSEKKKMRDLILTGGPFNESEKKKILKYCSDDVDALSKLFKKMYPRIDFPRALMRGEYMASVAAMEYRGIPIDGKMYNKFLQEKDGLANYLIGNIGPKYGIYEGQVFKYDKFISYLDSRELTWPTLDSGRLDLRNETFKDMVKLYPELNDLRMLRETLTRLKNYRLSVGKDYRNRCLLSPFKSKTGRNQPSGSKFIYGHPKWARSFIKPTEGMALAYIDYSQQEFGIAAALSKDKGMIDSYNGSDPYLNFAMIAGQVPMSATKKSHPKEREIFKTLVLAVQFCMTHVGLARRLGKLECEAKKLMRFHSETFSDYWAWSDQYVNSGMLVGKVKSLFGWSMTITHETKPNTVRNFPMQANGAEMMRIASIYAYREGIRVLAPIHDAFLIEAPIAEIKNEVCKMQKVMKKASMEVLNGFPLRSEVQTVEYPNRFIEKEGLSMWNLVCDFLKRSQQTQESRAT